MTKMATIAVNSKTLKNPHLQNQKAFETWHETSGGETLQTIYKS